VPLVEMELKKIKEGDLITPKGIFSLKRVYYREDRIKNLRTKLKKIKIKKYMAWCDDPKSKFYNKQIKIPSIFNYEKLYRKDRIYDIIITLDYNANPIIKNKGSAIFLHVAKENYKPTAGCIALKKEDLIHLLSVIKQDNKIKIN
jgi:L,D-peptidoglycan transpeptidase YkuD (ErfK/YbiS/YcfS/YnhG family)